ncbi:MAG: hypothetical protein KFH98_11120 [Gemmatimonadetes bacterium]|nr:hypothetical protein [Gemmatimonadota bacterium]
MPMFEDWKQAWRQAVENFHREAGTGAAGAAPRIRAMEREVTSASGALGNLDDEIRRTRRDLAKEREAEQVCRRREVLAGDVGDDETVRIAAEFAQRHAERAAVLERKIHVLEDERTLLSRDVAAMRDKLAEISPAGSARGVSDGAASGTGTARSSDDDRSSGEFYRMEREVRERAAEQRLEELKRRMQQ